MTIINHRAQISFPGGGTTRGVDIGLTISYHGTDVVNTYVGTAPWLVVQLSKESLDFRNEPRPGRFVFEHQVVAAFQRNKSCVWK